jgi:hypothetical protein
MPGGARIRGRELSSKLAILDIDEGIRIEYAGSKIFINRNASGIFVVQFGDSDDFRYLESANKVVRLVRSRFGNKGVVWIY